LLASSAIEIRILYYPCHSVVTMQGELVLFLNIVTDIYIYIYIYWYILNLRISTIFPLSHFSHASPALALRERQGIKEKYNHLWIIVFQ
jgi:hypothetical protein